MQAFTLICILVAHFDLIIMKLAKNIITAFLALLLVNPACCCALNGCCSATEEAPVRSCCSGPAEDQDDDTKSPADDHTCMCSINKQYIEQGKIDLHNPVFALLPEPWVVMLPTEPFVPTRVVNLPQATHAPPGVSLRILYSVFRL